MTRQVRTAKYAGTYYLGLEMSRFVPMGTEDLWWLIGRLPPEIMADRPPDSPPFYLEVRGVLSPPGRYGHLDAYSRELTVTKVLAWRRRLQGYWFCHLQRHFHPYPYEVCWRIEGDFLQGLHESEIFTIGDTPYRINFRAQLQVSVDNPDRHRQIRRLELKRPLDRDEYDSLRIPLTYAQLVAIGGNLGNLTPEERAAKRVKGEDAPGFFPSALSAAGVALDSLVTGSLGEPFPSLS